jgi:hypothetical protein
LLVQYVIETNLSARYALSRIPAIFPEMHKLELLDGSEENTFSMIDSIARLHCFHSLNSVAPTYLSALPSFLTYFAFDLEGSQKVEVGNGHLQATDKDINSDIAMTILSSLATSGAPYLRPLSIHESGVGATDSGTTEALTLAMTRLSSLPRPPPIEAMDFGSWAG